MKISTILDQIDIGGVALPEFQRGYVWNREQVRGLMHSLYRKHPVGSLLVWATRAENATARGDAELPPGVVKLLLDGQQRITSLYGIIRGQVPKFFDGNARSFTGLHFHLEDELFEFYAPTKMRDNPFWIDVTELMRSGVGEYAQRIVSMEEFKPKITQYINRLNAVDSIKDVNLHIEEVTGEDKTVDVVVDIFNRVNSGGTKLSKGDLALAKICAEWPDARETMNKLLRKWREKGFKFRLELLLRCVNAIVTGEAKFSAMKDVDVAQFKQGMIAAEKAIDAALNMISSRLGLDHNRVLGSRSSLPLICRYLAKRGGHLKDYRDRDKLLYWYIHTFLWGRYAGSTETVLDQDLATIEESDGALDRLVELLRQNRGDLRVNTDDFRGHSRGSRFYPMLYMMTRVCKARDWDTGTELSSHLLGSLSSLQVHHIFPKAMLYKKEYSRSEVNAIANFTFLTQETNLLIGDREPAEYLEEVASKQPGALESHWIPMDRSLWQTSRYEDFLDARRVLLAEAANRFLDSLLAGEVPEQVPEDSSQQSAIAEIPGGVDSEDEEKLLKDCNAEVVKLGLPEGEMTFELADPDTGDSLAILDLAWPDGLKEGLSQPVTILIDEGPETEAAANKAGFRFFTEIGDFLQYVKEDILADPEAGQGS